MARDNSLFTEICSDLIDSPDREHDVITFCENPVWGLGYKLRPVQRFLLRCFYGLPLDDLIKDIEITDMFREKLHQVMSEKEYFHFLQDQGRINLAEEPTEPFQEMVLAIGRRGTKSTTASMISSYEAYRLMRKKNPQEYYGILDVDDIRITNVANSVDQAGKLFKLAQGNTERCAFFGRYVAANTALHIMLRTAYDIDRYGPTGLTSVRLTVGSCNARAIRGGANIVVIMDEMAHFLNNLGNRSDSEIYDALTPSVGDFGVDGKILNLSSPLNKAGKFYELFSQGMKDSEDMLVLQIPSWEANSSLSPRFLRTRYKRDPARFMSEFGAEFSEAANAYIDDQDRFRSVVADDAYQERGSRRHKYFMGIDLGLVNDGTGITIGHVEWEQREVEGNGAVQGARGRGPTSRVPVIVHDTTLGLYAGEGPYEGSTQLLLDDVVSKISELADNFGLSAGVIDQWCGPPLQQALKKLGLRQIEMVYFNQRSNSEIYTVLKTLYLANQVKIVGGWDSSLVREMLTLEKQVLPNYLIKVEAPRAEGCHDDLSDSFARMVWIAYNKGVVSAGHVALGSHPSKGRVGRGRRKLRGKRRRGAYEGRKR